MLQLRKKGKIQLTMNIFVLKSLVWGVTGPKK